MNKKRVVLLIVTIITLITFVITMFNFNKIYENKIKPIDDKISYYEKLKKENINIKERLNKEEEKEKNIEKNILSNKEKREKLEKVVYEKEERVNGKVIYLTFDDGPSVYTDEILNILDKYNVKATFFVVCSNDLEVYSKKYIEKGHTIGIHTCTHKYDSIYSSEDAFMNELNSISNLIEDYTGYKSKYIRFPGGSSNTVSSFNRGIMTRLSNLLKEEGYKYYDWNIDSNDAGGANSEQIYSNVIGALENNSRNISMILMHDTKASTKDALEKIIVDALNMGYTFSNINDYTPEVHHIINN